MRSLLDSEIKGEREGGEEHENLKTALCVKSNNTSVV
jgi:hypothetical protein